MLIGDYLFKCRFTAQAVLPPFNGSTLRGSLGHALKKTVYALRRNGCDSCLLKGNCPYPFLFEVEKLEPQAGPARNRMSGKPHPYVLIPPGDTARHYNQGDPFAFAIKLFGRANDYLPHLVYCVELMGQEGLGRRKETTGTFALEAVFQGFGRLFWRKKTASGYIHSAPAVKRSLPSSARVRYPKRKTCISFDGFMEKLEN